MRKMVKPNKAGNLIDLRIYAALGKYGKYIYSVKCTVLMEIHNA